MDASRAYVVGRARLSELTVNSSWLLQLPHLEMLLLGFAPEPTGGPPESVLPLFIINIVYESCIAVG